MSIAAKIPISAGRVARTALQNRVRMTFVIMATCYFALAIRLVFLQLVQHTHFQVQADHIRLRTFTIPTERGEIVDRNGQLLAMSIPVADVIADPTKIVSPEQTAELVASTYPSKQPNAVAISNAIVTAQSRKLRSGLPIRYLKIASFPYSQVTALQALAKQEEIAHRLDVEHRPDNLAGISIRWRFVRSYPHGNVAAQILGFPSQDANGNFAAKYGVELSQNALLEGSNGTLRTEVDDAQRPIPGTVTSQVPVTDGKTVKLTIDLRIQQAAQEALSQMVQAHHAESGTVVALDPSTGDILAMASVPTFDPNCADGTTYSQWDDRAVSDLYEPGSTLKTLTLAAVLDKEGLQMANHRIVCTGKLKVGNHIIHCAPDPPDNGVHGNEDMQDVLRNSCNIGAALFAMTLGQKSLYHYEKAFGLLDKLQCGLPGANYSRLTDPALKPWSKIQFADVAFGQGVSTTALELASIYATIANHGVRVFPHVIVGQAPPEKPYQVVKPEVAAKMMTMLRTVVTNGTGAQAQVADYTIGGKTGSAQVAENGRYGDQYIGSFCGVAPMNDPKLVVLCVINKPVGVHWGAVVAAPVVRTVVQQSLWFMGVPPDAPGQAAYANKIAAPQTNLLIAKTPLKSHSRHKRHRRVNV